MVSLLQLLDLASLVGYKYCIDNDCPKGNIWIVLRLSADYRLLP